jgi:hypothetical protein
VSGLRRWGEWLPGIVLSVTLALTGRWLAGVLSTVVAGLSGLNPSAPDTQNLVSGIAVAVLLGLVFRNLGGLPAMCRP